MIDFHRNNLDRSSSPYLQQHQENPIHWQEWCSETLEYAREHGKQILVSIGYATCHWCHVMAAESFSDAETAAILNEYFVAIKIDREQRPDLDHYFMSYVTENTGTGGWPLNVILSPDGKPIFGGTYFPPESRYGMPSFRGILEEVVRWYGSTHSTEQVPLGTSSGQASLTTGRQGRPTPEPYQIAREQLEPVPEKTILQSIERAFDPEWAGFGAGTKFPPHCTLLFLMAVSAETQNPSAAAMVKDTLNVMARRGLHDHLQGGFYRYCIDRAWTVPHFEKMLYDQALLLWEYSWGYKLFGEPTYGTVAAKIIQCLVETFEEDGLYSSAHDADTDHKEGSTYLWSYGELKAIWTKEELRQFREVYAVSQRGNVEGRNHLIKREVRFLPEIERKLLEVRRRRPQPFTDRKIITSWNALLGIALLQHHRATGNAQSRDRAAVIFQKLTERHLVADHLVHSSLDGVAQPQGFLEDAAAVLSLATFLYEETWEEKDKETIAALLRRMEKFHGGGWHENEEGADFQRIPAGTFDHPTPSSTSLAEFGRLRAHLILESAESNDMTYRGPLNSDFFNMVAFLSEGYLHEVHAPERIPWKNLPMNCIQLPGTEYQDCYGRQCRRFESKEKLMQALQ